MLFQIKSWVDTIRAQYRPHLFFVMAFQLIVLVTKAISALQPFVYI